MTVDVLAAQELAASLLRGTGDRWRHTQSAAAAAAEAAHSVTEADRDILVAAAWLHDIGYQHPRPPTGFHPLDGAHLLLERGWPRRLAALVAHHSEARFLASAQGLQQALDAFEREDGDVVDALVYADMTAGPDGRRLTLRERLPEIRRRHADSPPHVLAARVAREPHLILAAARVDVRLWQLGQHHHHAFPLPDRDDEPDTARIVPQIAPEHPRRQPLDLHAAIHAARSLVPPSAEPRAAEVARCAGELLMGTLTLAGDGTPRR